MTQKIRYRLAFAASGVGALLLFWANGAVGIIGSENQKVNLLYGLVFLVGIAGMGLSRLRAKGMAYACAVAAAVQFLIPLVVLVLWPEVSWGGLGVKGVLVFNAFFGFWFVLAAMLFWRSTKDSETRVEEEKQIVQ